MLEHKDTPYPDWDTRTNEERALDAAACERECAYWAEIAAQEEATGKAADV